MIPKNVLPLSTSCARPNTQLEPLTRKYIDGLRHYLFLFSGGIGDGENTTERCDLVRLIPHAALFRLLALMFTADGPRRVMAVAKQKTCYCLMWEGQGSREYPRLSIFRRRYPMSVVLARFHTSTWFCLLGRQVA